MRATFFIGILALPALLVACAQPPMIVSKPTSKPPVVIPIGAELDTVEFARVVFNIRRGTKIGTYEAEGQVLTGPCKNYAEEIYWNTGRFTAKGLEFADIFFEELSSAGFPVAGDPTKVFGQKEERSKAAFAVGAQVDEIKMHVCDHADFWDAHRLGKQSGEASINVKWQVYSKLIERVVYETETGGHAVLGKRAHGSGVPDGEIILIQEAFGAAVSNLAADTGFRDLLVRKEFEPATTPKFAAIMVPKRQMNRRPIAENLGEVLGATVTISLGNSHGSGFVISRDGLILTNNHVVGKRKRVTVEFPSGLAIEGEVLRTHAVRDVALVRVPVRGLKVLPIRNEPARIGEAVYAIGTPRLRDLRATLTRGIVSAWRKDKRTKLELIQSDVDIQGGNSGGPLVDARGNVIGISVLGFGVNKFSAGLNFFIPIHDALAKLNLKIADK